LREEPDPRHQGTLRGIAVLENGQGKAEHLATNKLHLGAPGGGAERLPREPGNPREELWRWHSTTVLPLLTWVSPILQSLSWLIVTARAAS
jgi:hypothetical protein